MRRSPKWRRHFMGSAAPVLTAGRSEPAAPVRQSMDRFGSRAKNYLKAWFGGPAQRRLACAALMIGPIRHFEKEYSRVSDAEIRQKGLRLRGRARGGESLDKLL